MGSTRTGSLTPRIPTSRQPAAHIATKSRHLDIRILATARARFPSKAGTAEKGRLLSPMNKLFVLERDHGIDAGRPQGWQKACQQTHRNDYDAGACVYCRV